VANGGTALVKKHTGKLFLVAATSLVTIAALVCFAFLATYYYLKPTLPDVAQIRQLKLQLPLRVFSRDGLLIGQIGEQRRLPVKYDQVPRSVVEAFLAAEDDRFFQHPGIDWQGMLRALFVSAGAMEVRQGGSTLTQQLVRTTLIENERTLRRKLREIFLSLTLEHELSKEEILELYLNTVFLGQRAYGVAAAAETYFGKPLSDLTIAEAALLAGIPQAPSRYNPVTSRQQAERRRAYVLRRMRELDYINDQQYAAALAEPVSGEMHGPRVEVEAPYVAELVRQALFEQYGARIYTDGMVVTTTLDSRLQRAADVALRSALLEYDRRHGYRGPAGKVELPPVEGPEVVAAALDKYPVVGGLLPALVLSVDTRSAQVVTRSRGEFTLGFDGMRWARKPLPDQDVGAAPRKPADVVARGDVVYVLPSGPGTAYLAQVPDAQAALVSLDPRDGAVVAMTGGFDYYASKFNRATQARRQPGSSFKPFIYSAALEHGFTAASIILDAPVVYEAPDGSDAQDWRPGNDDSRFYGPIRLRDALARSRNLVSIRLMRAIGVDTARQYALRFGFPPDQVPANLTAALGTAQLTPLEIAAGYSVFANGGFAVKPYLIDRIDDSEGHALMQADPHIACPDCAEDDAAAAPGALVGVGRALRAIVPDDGSGATWMSDVDGSLGIDPGNRAASIISAGNAFIMTDMMGDVIRRGTGRRALALGRNDLAGKTGTTNDRRDAWFSGFNADLVATAWVGFDQERTLGRLEEGSRTALPMWIYYMREALRDQPEHKLQMPEGVVTARVSSTTGEPTGPDDPDAVFEYFLAGTVPGSTEANSGERPVTTKPEEQIF
jgi:penicillin-binding protein 1A